MDGFPAACVVDEVRVSGVVGATDAGGLIVVDGILMLEGSALTNQSSVIAALEATTGRVLWQQSFAAAPASRDVVAGVIVVGHGVPIGTLRGLDLKTGEELWEARGRLLAIGPARHLFQEAGSDALLCVHPETGMIERVLTEEECPPGPGLQPQWDGPVGGLDTPFIYRTVDGEQWPFPEDEFPKAQDQKDLVTADNDDAAVRLRSVHDGTQRWEIRGVDLEELSLRAVADPEHGQVFLTSELVLLMEYAEDLQKLTALARDTGKVRWSVSEQHDHDDDRAIWFEQDGDRLYRLFLDEFVALDARSGEAIWTFPERVVHARPIDDRLILVGDEEIVWILDPPF
jgi:outer membrane protein assembly factor BamB